MSSPSNARINPNASRKVVTNNSSASRSHAFGASSISNSSRIVKGIGENGNEGRQPTRVYLDGVDVTPQSLFLSRIKPSSAGARGSHNRSIKGGKTLKRHRKEKGMNSILRNSSIASAASLQLSSSSIDPSSSSESIDLSAPLSSRSNKENKGSTQPKGNSLPSNQASTSAPQPAVNTETTTTSHTEPDDAESADLGTNDPEMDDIGTEGKARRAAKAIESLSSGTFKSLIAANKPKPIAVYLQETPTIFLFELISVCVAQDSSSHAAITARNKEYLSLCAQKVGSDKYNEGKSQTLQLAQKVKEVMTAPPATRDAASIATDWDIFDCMKADENAALENDDLANPAEVLNSGNPSKMTTSLDGELNDTTLLKHQVDEIVDATLVSPGCVLNVDGDIIADLKLRKQRASRAKRRGGSKNNYSTGSRIYGSKSRLTQAGSDTVGSSASIINYSVNMDVNSSAIYSVSSGAPTPSGSAANISVGGLPSQQDAGTAYNMSQAAYTDSNTSIDQARAHMSTDSNVSAGGLNPHNNALDRHPTPNISIGDIIAIQRREKVMNSQSLSRIAGIVERAVQQNIYHHKHISYRDFPMLTEQENSLSSVSSTQLPSIGTNPNIITSGIDQQQLYNNSFAASCRILPTGKQANTTDGEETPPVIEEKKQRGKLEMLWTFQCELTVGKSVSCLAWNSGNDDVLAVSYISKDTASIKDSNIRSSQYDEATGATPNGATSRTVLNSTEARKYEGLILFWSLTNPEYPERIYVMEYPVMSIEFSKLTPYLLAAGFANGIVSIYDTRADCAVLNEEKEKILETALPSNFTTAVAKNNTNEIPKEYAPTALASNEISNGKHMGAVWQVKWVSQGTDRGEQVVSISSDGRITEWSIKKGLSYSDLMTLKRVPNPLLGSESHTDGVISRQASGCCIDFGVSDPSVYFAATEDGMIHKCSVSYNEQYLQTYCGHIGPVYQLLVSPFCSDIFLSCSADWNVKLWHQAEATEKVSFRSVDLAASVLGISWCNSDALIFGSVADDGRIEIWDIGKSTLDPIITYFPEPQICNVKGKAVKSPLDNQVPVPQAETKVESQIIDLDLDEDNIKEHEDNAKKIEDQTKEVEEKLSAEKFQCTQIAFAPSAPVIVVGDSLGNVTVYRVPALAKRKNFLNTTPEDQTQQLLAAIQTNKVA